ncbi:hypothetical protein CRYUN_Cryun35bG0011700 [Craigia yunnanensis]
MKATKSPIRAVATWLRRQPPKMKTFLAVVSGMAALLFLRMVVQDHNNIFIAAEAVHALGTCVLIYKLSKEKTCAGLSLKSQEPTAIFLAVIPCAVLSLFIHPTTSHHSFNRICWAFCVYLEAISVMPRLRVMQNIEIIEPFTAHYVFALGIARFLSCAHWFIQVFDTRGHLLIALGYGLWPCLVLLSEIVQTFILADFCYYYVKSLVGGQLVVRLPSGVV